jgi:general secretion pathway protein A
VPASLFTQEAVRLIHERSRGIPRVINVICDNALVSGMALGHRRVERAMVAEVCQDLRLPGGSNGAPPGPDAALALAPVTLADSPVVSEEADGAPEALSQEESAPSSRFNFRFRWKSVAPFRPSAKVIE